MQPDTSEEKEWRESVGADESDDDDSGSWLDDYPSTTIEEAEPIDEATAGVDVAVYDLGEADMPPMYEIRENYPEEDDVDGEGAVYIHGEIGAARIVGALSQLLTERLDEVEWSDV